MVSACAARGSIPPRSTGIHLASRRRAEAEPMDAARAAPTPCIVGDRVTVRATSCTIVASERYTDCEAVRLRAAAPPDTPFGTLLLPFDRLQRMVGEPRLRAMRPRRWLHALRQTAAAHHPFGGLRCAAGARIALLPYQLEPALAMLRHARLRVLVADAVGLGKTIQAGLVLAEILDRNSSSRALVVTPAGLREQWHAELSAHFQIDPSLCDASWLRHRARELPADINPWALPGTYIASFDFLKRPEVLKSIEELLWDIVIVDEAHAVTAGTDRRAAVDAIAARSRRVLLLTGTPHSGDAAQFEALCRIGEGTHRTPLAFFRRKRSDVTTGPSRRSVLLWVQLSDAERRMHQLLERYTRRLWTEASARSDGRARLVAIVLRKRALSSATSLAASLTRRIELLTKTSATESLQLLLPLYEEDEIEDRDRDDVLGAPGLADPRAERRWLGALMEAARSAARKERKLTRLSRFLRRVSEPAIVFTEYRDTLHTLRQTLERSGRSVLTLHGGMTANERRIVQQTFNTRASLLLATDAAAEGLNLQQQCRLVIHFELPWNPLRLEQRTGRVDRIGQTRRVHEVALIADDTAERTVLAPLARRAARAQHLATSGGRMLELLAEARVAEAVITGDARALKGAGQMQVAAPDPRLAAEAAHEARRLARHREWVRPATESPRPETTAITCLPRRRGRTLRPVIVVY